MNQMMSCPTMVAAALAIGLVLSPTPSAAQAPPEATTEASVGTPALRDETRPAIVTATAVWLMATGVTGMALGIYFGLEPESCVQMSMAGQCLRTRVPSDDARMSGFALAGLSTAAAILGVVTAFIADS